MNKKDILTLSESYQKIYENTIMDISDIESTDVPLVHDEFDQEDDDQKIDNFIDDQEAKNMFIANLAAIRSKAHKILKSVEANQDVDAWMTEKIAVAANDLKDVCDAIEFR